MIRTDLELLHGKKRSGEPPPLSTGGWAIPLSGEGETGTCPAKNGNVPPDGNKR